MTEPAAYLIEWDAHDGCDPPRRMRLQRDSATPLWMDAHNLKVTPLVPEGELAALRAERDEANRVCEQWRQWSAGDQKQLAALRARVAELEAARQADEADAKRLGNENQRLRANLAQLWVRLGAIHGDAEKMLAGADPSAGGG